MSFPHPELPIGSLLAVICLIVCLPSHIRVRNVASTSLNLWLCIVCLIDVVNSFLWSNDMIVRVPIWCDISTKFIIASNLALPAAAFSICRFLCDVAKPNAGEQTKHQKRWRATVELFLCWGQPAIIMALHYIVQGHRFDIYEYIGCQPTFYVSWASLFIITFPPLVYCFGTFFYAGFALWYFLQRRLQFDELLYLRHPGMTTNRYIRLMVVATAEMIWGTPWYLFVMVANISEQPGLQPWVSWDYVHYDWQRVGQVPLSLLPPTERSTRLALWWTVPVSGYLFFLFFGFSEQAMKDYRHYFRWFRINVLRQDPRV
ncbi:fungal pheromone STE3G-protein-coupled receptor [Calocera viscosa TUFC12733]|uniref:Fungal pheromone STE3G-protein-coupled receptor n=1 Tax=Calocera viscosa (strain TUFC12733) TaxID=1330018 RepID=A0A167NBH5_CALVF|nr:fungal pheromone STE3G-protein-coupled receptor [Calocera viscosa TUFC12733]